VPPLEAAAGSIFGTYNCTKPVPAHVATLFLKLYLLTRGGRAELNLVEKETSFDFTSTLA